MIYKDNKDRFCKMNKYFVHGAFLPRSCSLVRYCYLLFTILSMIATTTNTNTNTMYLATTYSTLLYLL